MVKQMERTIEKKLDFKQILCSRNRERLTYPETALSEDYHRIFFQNKFNL